MRSRKGWPPHPPSCNGRLTPKVYNVGAVQIIAIMKVAATQCKGQPKSHESTKESADVATTATKRGPSRSKKQTSGRVQQQKQNPVRAQTVGQAAGPERAVAALAAEITAASLTTNGLALR